MGIAIGRKLGLLDNGVGIGLAGASFVGKQIVMDGRFHAPINTYWTANPAKWTFTGYSVAWVSSNELTQTLRQPIQCSGGSNELRTRVRFDCIANPASAATLKITLRTASMALFVIYEDFPVVGTYLETGDFVSNIPGPDVVDTIIVESSDVVEITNLAIIASNTPS